MDPADLLRAVRWACNLSQRELAALAGTPTSTVDRIEAGRVRDPGIATLERLLAATGHAFAVVDQQGRPLSLEEGRPHHFDRAGRCCPAHLRCYRITLLDGWWGWERIAWWMDDPNVPEFGYRRRWDPDRFAYLHRDEVPWEDAT